jgi:hypothetical protein
MAGDAVFIGFNLEFVASPTNDDFAAAGSHQRRAGVRARAQ